MVLGTIQEILDVTEVQVHDHKLKAIHIAATEKAITYKEPKEDG